MESPRESYKVFPSFTSHFWTWLTGKPVRGQQPLFQSTPNGYAAASILTYVAGLFVSVLSFRMVHAFAPLVLLTGWTLTVNGARRMISTVAHQCIHARFSGDRRRDLCFADWLSALTLTQTATDYHREHSVLHHRARFFSSALDPAGRFLLDAGFRPGKPRWYLWLSLGLTAISPRFHWRFLCSRLRSIFGPQVGKRGFVIALGWTVGLGIASYVVRPDAVVVGVLFPVVFLYQVSVLFEFISEHAWFVSPGPVAGTKYVHATHSWGRFCGRKIPVRSVHGNCRFVFVWLWWLIEHAVYHVPVRLLILPGDLPQHDYHHRNPSSDKWMNATYAREDDLHEVSVPWPPYQEFWGLHNAINHVFKGIAAAGDGRSGRG